MFSGLLPETLVEVGEDECKMIKSLSVGDNIISMDENDKECLLYDSKITRLKKRRLTTATLLELKSEDGKKGLLMVARDQKFFRTSALRKLNPELLKGTYRSREQYLKKIIDEIWIKAKDLEVGDRIRGSQYKELEITMVEYVKFKKKTDFYELSLNEHHTFYVVDSAGHYVLTHNLGFCAAVGIGILIGAVLGGGYAAWESHRNGVLSAKTVIAGVVRGGIIGGISAAAIYGGIALWAKHGPYVMGKAAELTEFIDKYEWIKDISVYYEKHKKPVRAAFGLATLYGGKNIREFVKETVMRESADIDFSGVDTVV